MTPGVTVETSATEHANTRPPSMGQALIPLLFLVVGIVAAVWIYGDEAIFGPVQVALVLSAAVAAQVGYLNGHSVQDLSKAAVQSVASAMGAIFILLAVGALIGAWNMSGTIATLADWGLRLLSPDFFFVTAAIICAAVAMAVGSSWTVMGTLGVALVAVGDALGLSPALAAGAVVSGAYFGDKMSPLSETTNLAAAVSGTELYRHIRSMTITTIPSILIALGIYLVLGLRARPEDAIPEQTALTEIETGFHIGVVPILPLLVVVVLALRKVPPVLAILAGALTGGLVAVIWQPDVIRAFVGDDALPTPVVLLKGVWDALGTGFVADTGNAAVDELLSGGGMASMLSTIWLIITALAFGGIMNHAGFLAKLIEPMRRRAGSPRGAMASAGATAIGINVVAADQYLALVLTGNVYKQDFEKRGIAPYSLSRQIEDTGTVTSVLVPWNACGAYAAGVLGVSTLAYAPFAFFNVINPIVSFLLAALGRGIGRTEPDTHFPPSPRETAFYGVDGQHGDEVPADGRD